MYIWIRAPTLGSHLIGGGLYNCNHHVKYILLFIKVRATVPWLRWFIVAGLGSQAVTALAILPVGLSAMADDNSSDSSSNSSSEISILSITGFIFRPIVFIYGAATLELIVKHNDVQSGEQVWSFGQIVAITIAIGGIVGLVDFMLDDERD